MRVGPSADFWSRGQGGLSCLVVAILGLCMGSCSPDGAGCGVALGHMVTDTVPLPGGISALEIHDRIHVLWRPSNEVPYAVLRAGEGVIDGLSLNESSGTLRVEDRNSCHWSRDLTAIPEIELVGMALIEEVQLLGQGDFLMVDTLHTDNLTIEGDEMSGDIALCFSGDTLQLTLPNGIGHAQVQGAAVRFRSFRSGFGDLNAKGLNAEQVMLHHAGLGQVDLKPEGYLFLELAGHGDVHLHGQGQERDIQILEGATGQVVEWP